MPRARRVTAVVAAVLLVTAIGLVIHNQVRVARKRAESAAHADAGRLGRAADARIVVPDERVRSRAPLVAELQPVTLSNCYLARIGGPNDGGYLMCANLIAGLESAYSYGIGGEDSWGCAISRAHRVPVHQYDCFEPTKVECPGAAFRLNAECVGPRTEVKESRPFDTLANHIARNGDTGRRLVVKMDVEGAEWETILATPDDVLAAIDQMAMELHGLDEPDVLAGLRKLKTHFYLVSVHFNNQSCTAAAKPLPASAYQVLLVNKRLGVPGPAPPGNPTPESLMAPDHPKIPDCQTIAR
jgi:hypothetical protein